MKKTRSIVPDTLETTNQIIANWDWTKGEPQNFVELSHNAREHGIDAMRISSATLQASEPKSYRKKSKSKTSMKDPKIIEESELQKYLDDGWTIQHILPSGKIVVEK